ncbi:TlpA family protein disulfide reductase [bacterium]
MRKEKILSFAIPFVLIFLSVFCKKNNNLLEIPLRINTEFIQSAHTSWVNFDIAKEIKLKFTLRENMKIGLAPGNVLVAAVKTKESPPSLMIKVDKNNNNNLSDEEEHILRLDSPITIKVLRKYNNGKTCFLKYILDYKQFENREGDIDDTIYWIPHYRTEGQICRGDSSKLIAFLDYNGDGIFNEKDFSRGTTLCIDMNGDKNIWGRDEWKHGYQLFSCMDSNYLLDELAEDGTYVKLLMTDKTIPEIGDQLPQFILKTTNGDLIISNKLRGKIFIMNYWDSWCIPCIMKFPILQKIEKTYPDLVNVIAINLDEPQYFAKAKKIINEYKLDWSHVMEGLGDNDPVWRILGSINGNRLGLSFYIIIDRNGKINYAGEGGIDLKDVKVAIEKLVRKYS